LAGGTGTRLWPRSRKQTPKQFVPILSRRTLFQETIARAEKIVPPERIFVAANKDYIDDVRRQSPQIPRKNIIGEPQKEEHRHGHGNSRCLYSQEKILKLSLSIWLLIIKLAI